MMRLLSSTFFSLLPSFMATSSARGDSPVPLVNFQVQQPPALLATGKHCTVPLVHHLFANSYYEPAVLEYNPPTKCGQIGQWAGISLNYTATSNGTQYDRLSAVTLHNTEIWRTSTAEPTKTGIIWTALKDVSRYIPLFAESGTLILDLNNIVDPSQNLTGEYDVWLSATFYAPTPLYPSAKSSSGIISLSNFSPDQANYFAVPPSYNVTVTFPTNTAEAYAELYASGNGQEEFWYFNAADKYFGDLPNGATYDKGPFREVRILVDGILAGLAFPFPVIFTGGILPSLWRPISAYGAFDQPTYKVDLTPFVPLLADGKPHNITLDVASAEDDHSILGNWYLSGNIQVIQDTSPKPTTGSIISYDAPPYASSFVTGSVTPHDGYNDVNITVSASHKLSITSKIVTGSGKVTLVNWSQNLSYSNFQSYTQDANYQIVQQSSNGQSLSTHNGAPVVKDRFTYPLDIIYYNIAYDNTTGWYSKVDHSYTRLEVPSPLIPASDISTRQSGYGTRLSTNGVTISNGTTSQSFKYTDYKGHTYTREVSALNSSITHDIQGGSLASTWPWPWSVGGSSTVPEGGSGAHDNFAGRFINRKAAGKTGVW